MKKLTLLFAILAMGVAQAQWEQGGTLHKSTLSQWNISSDENRLATCADFAATVWKEEIMSKGKGWEKELLIRSYYLMTCVDEVAEERSLGYMKVAEVASACTILYNN